MSDIPDIRYEHIERDNGEIEYRATFELPQEWTDEQREAFAEDFRREVNRRFKLYADKRIDMAVQRLFLC